MPHIKAHSIKQYLVKADILITPHDFVLAFDTYITVIIIIIIRLISKYIREYNVGTAAAAYKVYRAPYQLYSSKIQPRNMSRTTRDPFVFGSKNIPKGFETV